MTAEKPKPNSEIILASKQPSIFGGGVTAKERKSSETQKQTDREREGKPAGERAEKEEGEKVGERPDIEYK